MENVNKNGQTVQPCEETKRFFATEAGVKFEPVFWESDDIFRSAVNIITRLNKEKLRIAEFILTRELQSRVI